jgi:hypothetical protein
MSPPSEPLEPADDSRKMLHRRGRCRGRRARAVDRPGLGLSERRMRYAETLAPVEHRCRSCRSRPPDDADPHAADRLRNELQLQPLKRPRLVGKAPVIAVARGDHGDTTEFARALAESYARARMKTLLIEADIGRADRTGSHPGLERRSCRRDGRAAGRPGTPGLWVMSSGTPGQLQDSAVSAPMVRAALERYLRDFDAIIVSGGSLRIACPASSSFRPPTWASLPCGRPTARPPSSNRSTASTPCLATAASRRCAMPCREIPGWPSEPDPPTSLENRHEPDHPRPRPPLPFTPVHGAKRMLRHRPERPAPPDDLARSPAHRAGGLGELSGVRSSSCRRALARTGRPSDDQVPVDVCATPRPAAPRCRR